MARELLRRGDSVSVLVRPSSDLWRLSDPLVGDVSAQVEVLHADFGDSTALRLAVESSRPDCIYHLAWEGITTLRRNDPSQVTRNVVRTLGLLDAAYLSGCQTFVGVGSQAEQGPTGPDAKSNEADLIGRGEVEKWSEYGVSKLCVGLLQQKFCELALMRGVWLRLAATYGPQDELRRLLPSVIEQLLRGEKPSLTPGEQRWDYLYVADAARAIALAGHEPKVAGTFDLGSGQAPTVRELVERARDLIDPTLPLGWGDLPYRLGQVMLLQADLRRLQEQMDWAPTFDLQKGLEQTVAWHRAAHRS